MLEIVGDFYIVFGSMEPALGAITGFYKLYRL